MSRNDNLTEAYNNLIEHLYEVMDDTLHSTADALEIAKEKLNAVGGLTQDEIAHIGGSLRRDLDHAALNSEEKEADLSAWLKFDINLIENFAVDSFKSLADKTRLELSKIQQQAEKYHPYKTGDLVSPGTFICDKCSKEIAFKSPSEIPACPDCGDKNFIRR
ncbi:MAG: zinc ribbon-containing protein [Methylococcales bacterium]|nr:zinc ribbon-containing protein [Methylococcales bacterium]